jgi:hypothetical protein
VDETGCTYCLIASFHISNIEPLDCVSGVGFYLKTSFVLRTREYIYG